MDLGGLLGDLYQQNGRLVPEDVVTAATPRRSPLHPFFEWDDRKAGHQYRLIQAATLIRSVKVTYLTPRQTEESVTRWRAVRREDGERTYVPIEEVVMDPVLDKLHRRDMERQWRALFARYQRYEEFHEMILGDLGK